MRLSCHESRAFVTAVFDRAEQVVSAAATVSEADGEFVLLVNPDIYNLVAFAEGHEPAGTTGDYRVVASTIDKATQAFDVTLPDATVVTQNFSFD
jgi:hypothetical protein